MDNKIAALKKAEMFSSLDDDSIARIAELLKEKDFNHDDVIIQKFDTDTSMYLIASGGVNIFYRKGDSEDLLLGHLVAGQHFGEMSLFDNRPRSAMVKAVGPTTAFVIEKDALFALIDKDHELGIRVLKTVAQELSRRLRDTSTALYVSLCIGDTTLDQVEIDKFKDEFSLLRQEEKEKLKERL